LRSLRAALVLQRSWRRTLFHVERCRASITIQGKYRVGSARRHYRVLRLAAVKAQSYWRQHAEHKVYLRFRTSTILIQSVMRRWYYGGVKASERKNAVLIGQKYVRRFLAQRLLDARKRHRDAVTRKAIVCQVCLRDSLSLASVHGIVENVLYRFRLI
jgi:hypothetical protein